jgi:acyl carrier protein
MHDRLRRVLADVFELAPEDVPDAASNQSLPGWDSLRQLELMLALELEYGVRIPADAMLELDSVAAIEEFLGDQPGAG